MYNNKIRKQVTKNIVTLKLNTYEEWQTYLQINGSEHYVWYMEDNIEKNVYYFQVTGPVYNGLKFKRGPLRQAQLQ